MREHWETMPFDREVANLLRSVLQRPAKGSLFSDIVARVTNWEEAIESARFHGILPMLYSRLESDTIAVPAGAMALAKREVERNTFHCMANAAELLEILRLFDRVPIPAMPFKGVVLASAAYGDIAKRPAGDLDLLIYRRDLNRATSILQERGYELKTTVLADGSPAEKDNFEFHFERELDGAVIELRWRLELTQPRFRQDLGMEWVWPRRSTAELVGAQVPNLDPVSTLLVLCMHGSKHGWTRMIWVCDVSKLLESQPQLDWDFAISEAKRVGLWRSLALGVLLALRSSAAAVPAEVLQKLEGDRSARRLADFLYERLPAEPGQMPGGLLPYNVQLLGFKDRLRMLLSPTFLRPNERDRALVKLPRVLEPLYYVIRPFRLLKDRTGR